MTTGFNCRSPRPRRRARRARRARRTAAESETATDAAGARERVVVTVTLKTRLIANGVEARVVRDVVSERGRPVEITDPTEPKVQELKLYARGVGLLLSIPTDRSGGREVLIDYRR